MEELCKNELLEIHGGKVSWGILGIVGGIITFFVGVFDGFTRPNKCK